MGGTYGYPINDVWSSADGTNWIEATASAAWSPRSGSAATVFNNRMWLIGGNYSSEVWSSTNGIDWVQATAAAPWEGRSFFPVVPFRGRMWVLGGNALNGNNLNDVWSSADGASWTKETSNAPGSARCGHAAVSLDDRIWMFGGGGLELYGTYLNDVWSSTDGVNWTQVTSSAQWVPRAFFGATTFKDRIWVLGGIQNSGLYPYLVINDVWYSEKFRPPNDRHDDDHRVSRKYIGRFKDGRMGTGNMTDSDDNNVEEGIWK